MTTATKKRTPMTPDEALAEIDWLVEGGLHPERIAEALGRSLVALERFSHRQGRLDLARVFKRPRIYTK